MGEDLEMVFVQSIPLVIGPDSDDVGVYISFFEGTVYSNVSIVHTWNIARSLDSLQVGMEEMLLPLSCNNLAEGQILFVDLLCLHLQLTH